MGKGGRELKGKGSTQTTMTVRNAARGFVGKPLWLKETVQNRGIDKGGEGKKKRGRRGPLVKAYREKDQLSS